MALTRFKSRETGLDGPVSGAIFVESIQFAGLLTNTTYAHSWAPPAGLAIKLVDIDVQAVGITSDPALTIGTAKAGTQLVAAVNLTTNLGSLTLKDTVVDSDDVLDVRIVTDAGDAVDGVSVTITGYLSAPPDSLAVRHSGHF